MKIDMYHSGNGKRRNDLEARILTHDKQSKERINIIQERIIDFFEAMSDEHEDLTNYEFAMSLWLSAGACLWQDLMIHHDIRDDVAESWVHKHVLKPAEGASVEYAKKIGIDYDP